MMCGWRKCGGAQDSVVLDVNGGGWELNIGWELNMDFGVWKWQRSGYSKEFLNVFIVFTDGGLEVLFGEEGLFSLELYLFGISREIYTI